mmetsp:Transcript_48010/g.124498  ORF Transcript_48010/g.124498 Transcript_48010/m.124498 type:complete len:201 (+) Transcript_48010:328-930(+)
MATLLSSISSCLRMMRRALRKWFSSGRRFAPGSRFSVLLVPFELICSVCTSSSLPPFLEMATTTTSTIRTTLPEESSSNADSPLTSSAENSFRVFAPSAPNLLASTPQFVRRLRSASSPRPMGARTSVETFWASGCSLICLSSHSPLVIQPKSLVLPSASVACQALNEGNPTLARTAASAVENVPATSSLRWTDLMPGYD